MYNPAVHQESRPETLHAFIRETALGTLVTTGPDGLDANHLPLVLSVDGSRVLLSGHVSRSNPVWRQVEQNSNVLVVFLGPHAYVTPQWYPSKLEHARAVPTWNYATVHAHGTARSVADAGWLRNNVEQLTNLHESKFAHQWKVSDAPEDFLAKMVNGIVGVEIEVTRLEGKWKMSQNREARDKAGVVMGLQNRPDGASQATAAMMVK